MCKGAVDCLLPGCQTDRVHDSALITDRSVCQMLHTHLDVSELQEGLRELSSVAAA